VVIHRHVVHTERRSENHLHDRRAKEPKIYPSHEPRSLQLLLSFHFVSKSPVTRGRRESRDTQNSSMARSPVRTFCCASVDKVSFHPFVFSDWLGT